MVWLWRTLALLFVTLGLIGVVIPGLPTTPFMLLAVWASAKGWPQLHDWLINHPYFGYHIKNWQQHRIVPRRAKILAITTMLLSMVIIHYSVPLLAVKLGLYLIISGAALWLWFCTQSPKI